MSEMQVRQPSVPGWYHIQPAVSLLGSDCWMDHCPPASRKGSFTSVQMFHTPIHTHSHALTLSHTHSHILTHTHSLTHTLRRALDVETYRITMFVVFVLCLTKLLTCGVIRSYNLATLAVESGAALLFLPWCFFSFLFFHVSIAHWSIPCPFYVFSPPKPRVCLWPAGEPGVPFLAISCPSLLFLLEECFCIFLTGINRLVLDRFVRQRVHNYGHDMYINNTHWLIETCLFVCNVGIYIYIHLRMDMYNNIYIYIYLYKYNPALKHLNLMCCRHSISPGSMCSPFFLEKMPSFYVLVFRYTYMIMYVCMYVWM